MAADASRMLAVEVATTAIASSQPLEAVTPRIMEAVCDALGCVAAATWIVETTGLRLCAFWSATSGGLREFERRSREEIIARGVGLPGRVWATGEATWIADVTRYEDFPRRAAAVTDGLHTALGVPIVVDGEVHGVMEFFSRDKRQPDDGALRMVSIVGTQVGLLIERLRAQAAEERSEAERKRVVMLLSAERRVLEMVARGDSLRAALEELAKTIEEMTPGMLASILLVEDGSRLTHGASPSLPLPYSQALDGVSIGAQAGSCGTAAYRNETVVSADIASDPLWEPWRELALLHGLRACWSTPIRSAGSPVLGTFALYYREPRVPDAEHLALIDAAAHVAGIAIERHRRDAERAALIEDLQRAVRFTEMFVGVLGHDLRNPLGAILTATQVLLRNPDPALTAKLLPRILSSGGRMNRMIAELLDFTRLRLGHGLPIERREVDLAEVCRHVIDELSGGDPKRCVVQLQCDGDTFGLWDGDRLLQLVSNLVGNAVEHGSKEQPVGVELDGRSGDQVILRVSNVGEVSAESLPGLFDPFKRPADTTDRRRRGLGLGLFISRHVARAHGGDIEVTTSAAGTCFTVGLPRRDESSTSSTLTFSADRPR